MVSDFVRVYGSLLTIALWAVGAFFVVALFVSVEWTIDTIGLPGLAVLTVGMPILAVLSYLTDLPGNVREAFA
ncbi:hypothetical protein [Halobacterium salinarum]|uniref:Uncharacterized protein n=4 Tax=Halobacterium salinarum TaxID=2242 RepID=Q9HSG7_HALSA|nr:hypothetical protein [Halobacterium salinarum]AAG18839.1 hypothetical protein VNG_0238H [Halobacterium salinarum NRC-1]MBB6090678.1 hypothetical protein [Halobacterium salinarum]MCF2207162.1 hypothetical protein [Halobacterium salinarum]MCF2240535.1 hypothetical protein [Halobacterium salinarum]MDL0125471.1 hypothetical protein [Halobacterium salinarum]